MDMLLAHHTLENLDLKNFAGLANKLARFVGHIPFQCVITILGDKRKVVLDLENRMTAILILHLDNPVLQKTSKINLTT